jgi:pimeloyl-ACP methyl ester carboxylesterase
VHFQHLGDGAPLVLLHQAPMTSGQFDRVYAPLARRGIQAIGIDMPGFGLSDPTPHIPTVTDYGSVVPAVLAALTIDRAAILGHHTGALAATEATLLYPELFSALILNGPLPITDAERADFMAGLHEEEKAFRALPDAAHLVSMFRIRDQLAGGTISDDRLTDYVVQAMSGRGAYWWGHHAAFQYDHAATLPRIAHPCLILTNSGDLIYENALWAHRIRPDFAFACLEGGGVDIVDQQPEVWADEVAAFVLANP